MQVSIFALGCVVGLLPKETKANLSALGALKIAQRRLKPEVRDSLLIVSSRRMVRHQFPSVWRFVFQDVTTTDAIRVVTVSCHAADQAENLAGSRKEADLSDLIPIDQERIVVDSDEVLRRSTEIVKVEWSACELSLIQCRVRKSPIWRVNFFEFENSNTALSSVTVNADTGDLQ